MTDLRTQLRTRRQSLSFEDRQQKSEAITAHLSRYLPFVRTDSLGIYRSLDEEVDTTFLIGIALERNKAVYLPIVNQSKIRDDALLFARYVPGQTRMKKNQYGILEPDVGIGECSRATELPFICVPMVGFNKDCDRMGMGAGYYDRALETPGVRKTHLVGLAFACQQAEFEAAPHDVPMNAVATEDGMISRD